MRLPWLLVAFLLACVLAGLHFEALERLWYWYHRWLDIPMHFLAGIVMGCAVAGVLGRNRPAFFFATVLAGAVGWEVFEYFAGISTGQPDYWTDTIKDIANGVLGGAIVYLVTRITVWRSN